MLFILCEGKMKVNYKKTILQRIDDEKLKAARDVKKIESIELTYEEWSELLDYLDRHPAHYLKGNAVSASNWDLTELTYDGIKLFQETRMV